MTISRDTRFDFTGRTVFVAGGTSGINQGIAEAFKVNGATVGVFSRSQEKVDAAVARLDAIGGAGASFGMAGDVRKPETVQAALEAFHAAHGEIDVVVSGAAGNFLAPAAEMSPNAFATVIGIDLNGTFNVLRLAHPLTRKPGGSMIVISAPQSTRATMYQAHACAAKAGIDQLIRVLALEWGPDGIRVNGIVPGPIVGTEGVDRLFNTDAARQQLLEKTPLRRMGGLDDCANMAMVLSTDLSKYVTSAIIPVDGGTTVAGGSDYGSDVSRRNS